MVLASRDRPSGGGYTAAGKGFLFFLQIHITGGRWPGDGRRRGGGYEWEFRRQRHVYSCRLRLRNTQPLCQSREGASRSIPKGAERCQQHGQEDVHPPVSLTLDHAEQATLDHLQRVGLDIRQNKQ